MQYEILRAAGVAEMIRLLAAVFSQSEPPAVAMGLSSADLEQFLQLLGPQAVADGLTVVARDADTGETVGALLTDDFAAPPRLDVARISEKFLPILSILEALDEQYRKVRTVSPGECLHLFMLAVDRRFSGRGMAQGLVQACLDNGMGRGYRLAVTEATGTVSQHVFRKQGFRERFQIAYQDFRHQGRAVFASIRDHSHVILMEKSLP